MSDITKKYKALYWVFAILSFCLTFVPFFVYLAIGYLQATTAQKVVMSALTIAAIIISLIGIFSKYTFRGVGYIIIIALYISLAKVAIPILIIAICTIIDELIVCPLKKNFREKFRINREIDKRENERAS